MLAVLQSALQSVMLSLQETVTDAVVKPSLARRAWNAVLHSYHGFRLLAMDIRVAIRLLRKTLRGESLTRRERKQVSQLACLMTGAGGPPMSEVRSLCSDMHLDYSFVTQFPSLAIICFIIIVVLSCLFYFSFGERLETYFVLYHSLSSSLYRSWSSSSLSTSGYSQTPFHQHSRASIPRLPRQQHK